MKISIWSLCVVLVLFWTGLVALAAQAASWIAEELASGQIKEIAGGAAQWPAPAWLPAWIDLNWIQTFQSMMLSVLNTVADLSPQLSSAVAWMVPLVWVVWGVGLLSLLALTGGAHWLISRWQRSDGAGA